MSSWGTPSRRWNGGRPFTRKSLADDPLHHPVQASTGCENEFEGRRRRPLPSLIPPQRRQSGASPRWAGTIPVFAARRETQEMLPEQILRRIDSITGKAKCRFDVERTEAGNYHRPMMIQTEFQKRTTFFARSRRQ